MPQPDPAEPLSCSLCHGPLAEGLTIPTTSGGAVHIRCAEAQASVASRRRAVRAAVSALVGGGGWALSAEYGGLRGADGGLGLFLLTVLLIAVHVRINRRWWQYTIQRARLWWRMHGKG
jgi:hypothetical protein